MTEEEYEYYKTCTTRELIKEIIMRDKMIELLDSKLNGPQTSRCHLYADAMSTHRLLVDQSAHNVELDGRAVQTTRSEYAILIALIGAEGQLCTRQFLLEQIGYEGEFTSERLVDSHIKNLRKKLNDDVQNPSWIMSVHGCGYRFIGLLDDEK